MSTSILNEAYLVHFHALYRTVRVLSTDRCLLKQLQVLVPHLVSFPIRKCDYLELGIEITVYTVRLLQYVIIYLDITFAMTKYDLTCS